MYTDYLKQYVTVQKVTQVSNGMGGYTDTWSTHIQVNGYIDLMSGAELVKANKLGITATHILMCEFGKDISEVNRISFDNKIYRIQYVDTVFYHHMEVYLLYDEVDN